MTDRGICCSGHEAAEPKSRLSPGPERCIAMNSAAERPRGYLRRIASGVSLLIDDPGELPRSLLLAARYTWNVYVRRKRLMVLVREGGLGDLVCVLASVPGLRDRHPDAWFVVITPRGGRRLA